ncbi:MAG: Trp biosynthesis-associated membrane protein [Aeromicrobium sp.]
MRSRRLYVPVVLATLAVGGLAFFAVARHWASVRIATDGLPSDSVSVTGADAYPLASALALVVVTSALAILASSPRIRRGVGVLIVLVSIGAVVAILDGRDGLQDALRSAAEESPAYTGGDATGGATYTAWNLVAVVAFVLSALLGAVTARFGHTWPTMSSRYDAPAARPAAEREATDADMWKAMDEGHDPTQ